MNVKPTPTSPKAKTQKEIEKLYSDSGLGTINQPVIRRLGVSGILLASLVGIVGGVGGVFGIDYALRLSGSPSLFASDDNSGSTTRAITRSGGSITTVLEDAVEDIAPSTVSFFAERDPATPFTGQLYTDEDRLGTGSVMTSDGWLLGHRDTFPDLSGTYVAVTDDRRIFEVKAILRDPQTDFYFLKIDASGLTAVEFASPETIMSGQTVVAAEGTMPYGAHLSWTALVDVQHRSFTSADDTVESSETFTHDFLLSESYSAQDGAIIADVSGKAIGFIEHSGPNNSLRVRPAAQFRSALSSVLKNGIVRRNILGVETVDLSSVLNVPTTLSQARERGALVTTAGDTVEAVVAGSPADVADLVAGDIIVKVGSAEVNEWATLSDTIQQFEAGASTTLTVIGADGQERSVPVTFDIAE